MPATLATTLTPAGERHVRAGHPWVYSESVERVKGTGRAGDLAVVFDRRRDRFLAVGLYDPEGPIRIRVLHRGRPTRVDAAFFRRALAAALARRAGLLATDTTAYRLVNGESDGFPGLVVDVYAHVAVVKVYSAVWVPWLQVFERDLLAVSGATTLVLRLSRQLQRRAHELPPDWAEGAVRLGVLDDPEVVFREHGVRLRANVIAGHKTGFFLDHRANRLRVGRLSPKRRVLDVFSYAGGFSAHALAGGAAEVTAVDISAQALALAEANARLNVAAPALRTIADDAFAALASLAAEGEVFGVVVVDPPSFAKRASEVDGALQAYRRLTRLALPLVAPGGTLVLASCSARVTAEAFYALQLDELRRGRRAFREAARTGHDADHPADFAEARYLKTLYVEVG